MTLFAWRACGCGGIRRVQYTLTVAGGDELGQVYRRHVCDSCPAIIYTRNGTEQVAGLPQRGKRPEAAGAKAQAKQWGCRCGGVLLVKETRTTSDGKYRRHGCDRCREVIFTLNMEREVAGFPRGMHIGRHAAQAARRAKNSAGCMPTPQTQAGAALQSIWGRAA